MSDAVSESDAATVGKRIRDLRTARGWSQADLSRRSRVSRPYVSDLETGKRKRPSFERIARLAAAFGVPEAHLIHGGPLPQAERIEEAGPPGYGALPVYAWGTCGDPTDAGSAPLPYTEKHPPHEQWPLVTASGFGVLVHGESMARRGIHDGCICWVNPRRRWSLNQVVLALVRGCQNGETGMVVKTYRRIGDREVLVSQPEGDDQVMACESFEIKGLVVWVSPPGYPPQPAP